MGHTHKALYEPKGRLSRIPQYIHSRPAQTKLLSKKFCIWQPCNAHLTSAHSRSASRSAIPRPRCPSVTFERRPSEGPSGDTCLQKLHLFPFISVVVFLLGLRCCMSSLFGLIISIMEDGQHYRLVSIVPVAGVGHFHVADTYMRDRCRMMGSAIIATVPDSAVPFYLSNRMVT